MKTATHELATTVQPGAALYGLESHPAGQSRHLWRRISAVARWPANSRPGISGGSVEQDMAIAQAAMAAINVRTHQ